MGLDQFAYMTKVKPTNDVDFQDEVYGTSESENDHEEIHYWRKHPNLHGYMERLYREKGGESEFNCRPVQLEQQDIDQLALAIINNELPRTSGFFFGESEDTLTERQEDLEFCKVASNAIKEGYTVFYDSWW